MAGAKANFVSFYIRRIGRILPIYYAIHFAVLLANSQAWSTDFKESVDVVQCWLFAPLPSKLLFWARQSIGASPTYPLGVWLLMVVLGTLDEVWSRSATLDEYMDLDFWFYETRHNVFIFTLGICCCEVAQSLPPARGIWNWFWPLWCDATLIGTLLLTASWSPGISWGSSFWSGCYAPVALWVLSSTLGYQSLLNRLSLLQLLGEYSMQIYLLANPMHDFVECCLVHSLIPAGAAACQLLNSLGSQQSPNAEDIAQLAWICRDLEVGSSASLWLVPQASQLLLSGDPRWPKVLPLLTDRDPIAYRHAIQILIPEMLRGQSTREELSQVLEALSMAEKDEQDLQLIYRVASKYVAFAEDVDLPTSVKLASSLAHLGVRKEMLMNKLARNLVKHERHFTRDIIEAIVDSWTTLQVSNKDLAEAVRKWLASSDLEASQIEELDAQVKVLETRRTEAMPRLRKSKVIAAWSDDHFFGASASPRASACRDVVQMQWQGLSTLSSCIFMLPHTGQNVVDPSLARAFTFCI
eukprot:s53_g2.t3